MPGAKQARYYGKEAISKKWTDFTKKSKKGKEVDTQFFVRTFSWMLTSAQRDEIQHVVSSCIANARAMCLKSLAIANGKIDGDESRNDAALAGSASSSTLCLDSKSAAALQAKPLVSLVPPTHADDKGTKQIMDDKASQKDLLLSLFKKQNTATQ